MVFQPCLTIAPSNPAASQQVETGNDNGDSTDDAKRVPRLTETPCLIDA